MTDQPMGGNFLASLSESKLISSERALSRMEADALAELAYLHILALRILLAEPDTKVWAKTVCRKTVSSGGFRRWRTDATDLYAILYGLTEAPHRAEVSNPHDFDDYQHIATNLIINWLRAAVSEHGIEDATHRLFARIDTMLRVKNSSLRALRRLILDWPDLDARDSKLAMTRLLQFFRARAAKGEVLLMLNRASRHGDLELHGVCDLESGAGCGSERDEPFTAPGHSHSAPAKKGMGLMGALAAGAVGFAIGHHLTKPTSESATAGATSAGNVATVVGGLGTGFDADHSKSIYPAPKKAAKPNIIKRT